MFNTFSAYKSAGRHTAKHLILASCFGLLASFANQTWANDNALEIKLYSESTSVKLDNSTEISVFVSKEKAPAANAQVRWTQTEGPANASLYPSKGKTNAKGVSQLRVVVHTAGKYKFLAEVCGASKSKTFCEEPAKSEVELEANAPVPVGVENILFGSAIAAPLVAATAGENLISNSNSKVKFASLTAQTSTDINGAVNAAIPLSALYLFGETGFAGQSVNWIVTPVATLSSSNTPVSSSDGLVGINFQASAPGTYFVTATGTCPSNLSSDICAPPIQNFRIRINAPSLVNISGNSQSAGISLPLAAPLVVQAQNAGVGTPGVSITWTVVSGSASLGSASSTTNSVGLANNIVTMGATAGPIEIRAQRADAASAFVLFTVNAVAAQLDRASPAAVSGSSSGSFNLTTFSNFAGVANSAGQVNWTSSVPAQTNFSSASTTLDAAGRSNVTVTTTQGGSYVITACWNPAGGACVSGNPTTSFTVNSNSLRIVSGNSQALAVSQASAPLAVQLLSGGFANPQTIIWSVTGPATLSIATSSTNAGGSSSNTLTFTGAGNAIATARWPSIAGTGQPTESVSFNLSATSNAYRITPNSSLNTAGTIGVASNLSVDYRINAVAATSLLTQWSIVSGPGGGTLGSATAIVVGSAASVNTFTPTASGIYRIRAQGSCPVTADPDCPGNSVEFLINTSTTTRTLNISSGNGQSAANNAAFASPLVVLANDNGSPASGAIINWVVTSGDSTLLSGFSITNASGLATINATAGPSNGASIITATRADEPSAFATFTLNVGSNTYTLVANGSNNYDLPLGFGLFLSSNYTINGAPAIGRNVLWTTASGFLTSTSVAVDALGNAETLYFPPNAVGVYTVSAVGDCPSGPAPIIQNNSTGYLKATSTGCPPPAEVFTITVIDKSLALTSGDGQTTPLATAYTNPLRVQALNNGVAVAGVQVSWNITSGAGTFTSANPSLTDASGFASITLDAGNIAGTITVEAVRQDSFATVNFNLQATGNTYALITLGQNIRTININAITNMDVNYLVNGVADLSLQTLWSTSGGTLGSATAAIDNAGDSSNTFSSAVVGTFTVTVDGGCPAAPDPACPIAPVTFTINVIDPAQTLSIAAGNNQTAPLGTSFPLALQVLAQNSGVAASGVTINWSRTSGNATLSSSTSTSNATGNAQITVDATGNAGAIQITATRSDSGATVVFDLNSTPAPLLEIVSGNNQSGPPNTAASSPIVVRLTNGGGIGLVDETIDWTLLSGDAVINSSNTLTASDGTANVTFSFGNTPGPLQIRATAAGFSLSVTTNHEVLATTPTLNIASGDNQSTTTNTPFSAPLVVLAENSSSPASGVTINWVVTSGDASLSSPTSTTDAAGNASINVNAGATTGAVVITGTRNDAPTATISFTLNINTVVSTLALTRTSGNGQAAFIGTAFASPLVVHATNNGVADPGITINWVLASGNAALSSGSSITDSVGSANITVTAGAAVGPVSITATRADEPTAIVTFALNNNPTPNSLLSIVSGNSQSGVIGSTANSPIVVVLRDGFGNAIASQPISWTVISGPATLSAATSSSDAGGQASNTFTFGTINGASVIRATAFSGTLIVDFAANAVMVSLAAASGNGQAGPVSTALPVALTVQISPPAGVFSAGGTHKPLALGGVPISFAITGGGGSVSVTNTVTNGAGQASTVLTLGPAAGVNTVSATVLGGPSTSFNATGITVAVASGLTIVSGNNQVLDPAATSSPLTIELRDGGGAVIVGATINWATTGGTLASATSVTNASGRASNTIQLNGLGTAQVSATAPAFASAPVVFNLNLGISNLTGLNPLQSEVANAIDTLCPALANTASLNAQQRDLLQQCQSILGSAGVAPQDTINALDEMFSDVALAQANAAMLAAQSQFQNLKARIAALRSGTGGDSFGGLALNMSTGSVSVASLVSALTGESNATDKAKNSGDFERWGFFASGSIGRGEAKAGSINPAFDYDINGLSAGVDYRMNDRLIVGAALGFTQQGTILPGSAGSVDTAGWSASAYSTFYQQNNWYADAVMTYGHNRFDLQRHIKYTLPLFGGGFTTVDQIANANTDGSMLSAAFTFGRDFQRGGLAIGPYGRLTYTKLDFDAYDELLLSGNGSGLGLHIENRSLTSLATVLGSKFAYSHSTDWGVLMPHLQIEWEREFKDDPQTIQASFIYDPTGTPISVTGDQQDKSFFRIGLGLSMILTKGRSGFIYYEKMIGRDKLDQDTLSMGLRMEF